MAITGSEGVFSFGPQTAKGTAATTYYKHLAQSVGFAWNDPVEIGPLEVGGGGSPTFPYKVGEMGGGPVVFMPRLEDTFGWLLYGMLGKVTSAVNVVDNYTHEFERDTVPFMTFRKHIPRVNGAADTDLGEIFLNSKIINSQISFPNMAPVQARMDILSTEVQADHDPSLWTYANADFEDYQSIPLATAVGGHLQMNAQTFKVVQASFGWMNRPLPIQQERIAFDPHMDDITIVERRAVFDLLVKWDDPDLYAQLRTGSATGTTWAAAPFTAPVNLKVVSQANMPSSTPEPYSLEIDAPSVSLTQQGGVTLAGGETIMMRLRGTALENDSHYIKATLLNMVSDYTWPT